MIWSLLGVVAAVEIASEVLEVGVVNAEQGCVAVVVAEAEHAAGSAVGDVGAQVVDGRQVGAARSAGLSERDQEPCTERNAFDSSPPISAPLVPWKIERQRGH